MMSVLYLLFVLQLVSSKAQWNFDEDHYEVKQCSPIDGKFGDWMPWSPCSISCAKHNNHYGGEKVRYRYCNNPIPQFGGTPCTEKAKEVEYGCNKNTKCPTDGGYGDWIEGKCTHHCGGGTKTNERFCNSPKPSPCGGKTCVGHHKETKSCNVHECPLPCQDHKSQFINGKIAHELQSYVTDWKYCKDKTHTLHKNYPGFGHYFLKCGAQAWCMSCATKTLVFNPKCHACEATSYGPCTGKDSNSNENIIKEILNDEILSSNSQ